MSREEAIRRIKAWGLDPDDMEVLSAVIPELAESEDERIRKIITDSVFYQYGAGDEYNDVLDYFDKLEKQKEQMPVEYLDKDKVYAIMKKLHKLAFSQLIPINSDEFKKIDEITSDVRKLLDYPIKKKPADNVSREEYVKRFKVLCDAYEIKLPNREYDIYHLCDDLAKLFTDSGKQKPIFRVGDTIIAKDGTDIPQEAFHIERIEDGYYWDKEGGSILISNQDEFQLVEQKPTSTVKSKFKSGDSIRFNGFGSNEYTIQLVGNGYYVNSEGGRMDMSYTDANFVLVENAQKDQKPIFKKGDRVIWDGEEFNILDVDKDTYNVGGYIVPFSREGELHPISQKSAEWSDDIIRKAVKEVGLTQHQIDWFKTNVFPPKQKWTKEDCVCLA